MSGTCYTGVRASTKVISKRLQKYIKRDSTHFYNTETKYTDQLSGSGKYNHPVWVSVYILDNYF